MAEGMTTIQLSKVSRTKLNFIAEVNHRSAIEQLAWMIESEYGSAVVMQNWRNQHMVITPETVKSEATIEHPLDADPVKRLTVKDGGNG